MEITAEDIFSTLPARFKEDKAQETEMIVHFDLLRDKTDNYQCTVNINKGVLNVEDGLQGEASCLVRAKEKTYVDLTLGKGNPQMAVLMGKVKVSSVPVLMQFIPLFSRFSMDYLDNQAE